MGMPAPSPILPDRSRRDWTVEQLHALPDDGNRYEIVDGALLVTPAPEPHRAITPIADLERATEPLDAAPIAAADYVDVQSLAALRADEDDDLPGASF